MSRGGFIFAMLFVLILTAIAAMKSNGAVDHPLLVNSSVANPDPKMPAWRMMTLCPVGRRNIPTLPDERTA